MRSRTAVQPLRESVFKEARPASGFRSLTAVQPSRESSFKEARPASGFRSLTAVQLRRWNLAESRAAAAPSAAVW